MEISLDYARERLLDNLLNVVAYKCKNCENDFFAYDDTARLCPFCGGKVEVEYNWDVELIDWGYKTETKWQRARKMIERAKLREKG